MRKPKIPEDLCIKIGTPEQVIWESVLKETKVIVENMEKTLIVQKAILELADSKIQEEKEKLK